MRGQLWRELAFFIASGLSAAGRIAEMIAQPARPAMQTCGGFS
jgi:hypothetical protein